MRVGLGVVLAGAVLALPAGASAADFPPPIDKQVVTDQDDMTWADYRAVPGTNWADPTLVPSVRKLKIAVVAVDFSDQPFVITQPKGSDPFGNPQIDPIPREQVPKFYADFNGIPSALNNGHTVNEYWMEQTHGRIGMSFTPYGPYRMPRPLYEYGLNEFNQQGGCPAGHTCNGNMDSDVDALWRADQGANIRSQFDLVLRIYAGYDETTVWQEFGEMKFETKEEIPDEWGPPDPLLPNWVTNRYVPWTSWRAGAQQWGLSSIRQGESSGTITHEIVHTFGLPDNNNNPYVTPYHRVGSGPWDILDRGSFNGPGGPHKRWLVPVTQGGAMEAGMTLWTRLKNSWLKEADVHRVTRSGLQASGVQVMRVKARTVEPGTDGTLAGIKLDLDGAAPIDKTPACNTNTEPLCAGTGWQYYTLETVQRIGEDSMTPDSGVLIQKNKNNSSNGCGYGCFSWTIDAHPEDINKVDFLRPRTKTPVMRTVGDYRQLNDALFHAGTGSGSQYEFEDTPNRLHFYVLDVSRDATGVQSYDVAIRNLDGAGPHTRGVTVGAPTANLNAGGVSTCTFTVNNTGTAASVAPPASPLDDPNPYIGSDVYRLEATGSNGVQVHLTNALAAIKAGQSARIPVYFQGANGSVSLRATSESDPSKSAVGVCGQSDVGGTVPATLGLTLGTAASFGAFTPGATKDYTASTTANVISTAGDAALSVGDAGTNPGHLVNGAFALPEVLQVKAKTAANPGGAFADVGAATQVLTWSAPASNDSVTVDFMQRVKAVDALRTGAYAKTLTFTLSTTTP
ncbi:peptidase M6 [Solirubrobacter soli]|uniref:peptidase M6 n=1 Tax=Solirubrobacter soli TaxID=363832 RepID=UPI0012F8F66C|nr:peptidase M6 [Solirubrobacter soli]